MEQTTLTQKKQRAPRKEQIKCTNPDCKGTCKYNGYMLNTRFYKCDTCGKVTAINKKTGEIIKKGRWLYTTEAK